jgi:hypothetical protein
VQILFVASWRSPPISAYEHFIIDVQVIARRKDGGLLRDVADDAPPEIEFSGADEIAVIVDADCSKGHSALVHVAIAEVADQQVGVPLGCFEENLYLGTLALHPNRSALDIPCVPIAQV